MPIYSRRDFIKQLSALAAAAFVEQSAASAAIATNSEDAGDFNFLVVGDSLVWGQGLREEEKFYYLTKRWLETEIFNDRLVNLKVKAHSGANISLRPNIAAALEKAKIADGKTFYPEINIPFPSIYAQIEEARAEYDNPRSVKLIMLTGGLTDVKLSTILNPFKDDEELKSDIERYCNREMFLLLKRAAAQFPDALIVLVGYHPYVSRYTPTSDLFNGVLEVRGFPRALKSLVNNPLNRQILKSYRRKMVGRTLIASEISTLELGKAVNRLNAELGKQRAVFVDSPIKEQNSIGAKNSLVWEIKKKGRAKDPLAAERKVMCRETIDDLRKATNLKYGTPVCELASIGHPNVEGSKAIAAAIQSVLKPILTV